MSWTWDEVKNEVNVHKHGLSFGLAARVFTDPLRISRPDPSQDDRWQTIGMVGRQTILVVHTWPEDEAEQGRIISARKAISHEREAYERGDFT